MLVGHLKSRIPFLLPLFSSLELFGIVEIVRDSIIRILKYKILFLRF